MARRIERCNHNLPSPWNSNCGAIIVKQRVIFALSHLSGNANAKEKVEEDECSERDKTVEA